MAGAFTFKARRAKAAGSPSNYPSPKSQADMERILIVEDELPMRTALIDCLESEGYRTLSAANGKLGLETALSEKPASSCSM